MATAQMSILVAFSYFYWLLSNNMQNSEKLNYIVNIWRLANIFPFMYISSPYYELNWNEEEMNV